MKISGAAAVILLCSGVSFAADFKPQKCGNSIDDVSACYFDKEYCSYRQDFNGSEPLRARYWDQYNGDPKSADFVIDSGSPEVRDGHLLLPLTQNPNKNAASYATIVSTTRFLNYGSFEGRLRTIKQPYTVTTLISMSNVQDEIDFEFVPKNPQQYKEVQANWYSKGQAQFDVNFNNVNASSNTFDEFHTYRVDWTPEYIQWSVDGAVFNRLVKAEMGGNATKFPNTPARIQFGVWQAVGNEWAGVNGTTIDWSQDPDKFAVRFDYLRVIGQSCGGGELTADPPISEGYIARPPKVDLQPGDLGFNPNVPNDNIDGSSALSLMVNTLPLIILSIMLAVVY